MIVNPAEKANLLANKKSLQEKYIGAMTCDHCPGILIITLGDFFVCDTCGARSFIVDSLPLQDIPVELRADTVRHLFPQRIQKSQ